MAAHHTRRFLPQDTEDDADRMLSLQNSIGMAIVRSKSWVSDGIGNPWSRGYGTVRIEQVVIKFVHRHYALSCLWQ